MHYVSGSDRHQSEFFTRLDDMVPVQHYCRLIDLLVDHFVCENLSSFDDKGQHSVGRKAYHPSLLLKLYLYGYLNGISSSRKLERECHRNLEVIWLTSRLTPDHKTIADFRRQNGDAISHVVLKFNQLLKDSGYIKGKIVSIDGSKVRANAGMHIDLNTVQNRLENLEEELRKYIVGLDQLDQAEDEIESIENLREQRAEMQKQIDDLKGELEKLDNQKQILQGIEAKTISPTDTDARIMHGRQGKHFCYNVQAVVDAENHMIAHTEVTNNASDRNQLLPLVEKIEVGLSMHPEQVIADAGYYVLNQIEFLEKEKNIDCYVAISHNHQQLREIEAGITFAYQEENDVYTCSEGQELQRLHGLKKNLKRNTVVQTYRGINCSPCSLKSKCTQSKNGRSIARYSNQEWRDQYFFKMKSESGREKMRLRRSLSEHPFGTIKYWMGQIPLLTRGMQNVKTEILIYTLAYNFRRLLAISDFNGIKSKIENHNWKLA